MGMRVDVSGMESLSSALESLQQDMADINAEFLRDEFNVFHEGIKPITPVDTSQMQHSYQSSYVRKKQGSVEADWSNEALYSSFVNDGTKNPDGSVRIDARRFWQKGLNRAKEKREQRYQRWLFQKFDDAMR